MASPVIPKGWYQLENGEKIREGDRITLNLSGHKDHNDFNKCEYTIGQTVGGNTSGCIFIRKLPDKEKEKEWLNPWD